MPFFERLFLSLSRLSTYLGIDDASVVGGQPEDRAGQHQRQVQELAQPQPDLPSEDVHGGPVAAHLECPEQLQQLFLLSVISSSVWGVGTDLVEEPHPGVQRQGLVQPPKLGLPFDDD